MHVDGCRILIIGSSGAGKTSLATVLARKLHLERLSLDSLAMDSQWSRRTDREVLTRLQPWLLNNRWIVEGNYSGEIQEAVLRRATHVIHLEISLWRALVRASKRQLSAQHLQSHRSSLWRFCTGLVPWIVRSHARRIRRYQILQAQLKDQSPQLIWWNLNAAESIDALSNWVVAHLQAPSM
jgi:adenylate kinase family enzyme